MKRLLTLGLLLVIFTVTTKVSAQDYGVALKVSTLGFGIEGMRSFGPDFNVRAGAAFFSISQDGGGGTEDYVYTADANLTSVSLLADYFPFGQTFRLTGGMMLNLNKFAISLVPTDSYTIGGDVYTPELLGTLNADINFSKIAPYIGIGFGNPMGGDSGLKFTFDIGTFYQGAPGVDLSAEGLISPSASPEQAAVLENNLDWFKWYPVLSLGLSYKF